MSTKLEARYQQELPAPKRQTAGELAAEETLYDQVMSNTCPICFELFLPPRNQPYILFPCGHTFCKSCIDRAAGPSKVNSCPFCRVKWNSMAPNLSLQNLVQMANDKN